MRSFLACFPPEYQITDHEGTVFDVPVVISPDGFEILCCLKTEIRRFSSMQLISSSLVPSTVDWSKFSTLGDPKVTSDGSTASEP